MDAKNLVQVASATSHNHEFVILGKPDWSARPHVPSAERKADARAMADVLEANLPLETVAFLALEFACRYAASREMHELMARAGARKSLPWEAPGL